MDNHKKILFVQKIDDNQFETEGLWCTIDGNSFVVNNIPFIAKRTSLGDTIKAEYDETDKSYYFDDFIAVSGNTTVRLYFSDTALIESTRDELNNFGCESEVLLQRKVVAVNVPGGVNYMPVKEYLDVDETDGKWTYEESCLAHKY
jgi:hypothetical protein